VVKRGIAGTEAAALARLQEHRCQLLTDLAALQRKLAATEQAVQLLSGQATPSPEGLAAARRGKYSSLPAQDAVERFLQDHPGSAFKPREVARELKSAGFVTKSKDFASQVAVALNRLCKKGIVDKTRRAGVTAYRVKTGPEAAG
jgi:hypothetical protein